MQRIPIGPTGTAMDKPMATPLGEKMMFVDGCSQEMHSYCTRVIPLSNRLALGIGNKDIQRNTQEPMQQNNKEKRMATPGHQTPNDSTS